MTDIAKPPHHPANALQLNLQRLLVIRMIVFVGQVLALCYARLVLQLALDYWLIGAIFVLLGSINGLLYLRLKQEAEPRLLEFFLHLLVDVLGLSLLLYFTGGANNPFVSYLLVPIAIAAATLTWSHTLALTVLALACYTLLLFFYQPLPALQPATDEPHALHGSAAGTAMPSLHILGMWFNFLVSAALITWFVVRMAAENRLQQERLSRYREDTLRNEQILAVAIQAAGTAHELGTPLGTMAIMLNDLRQEHVDVPGLQEDLQLLQQQVRQCRDALQSLASKADFKQQRSSSQALDRFIDTLVDRWRLLRPELPCTLQCQPGAAPLIDVDPTLQQALVNMLNNAADASPGGITLQLGWDSASWQLRIHDQGTGISRELASQLGSRIISTKTRGMGVGLVLSQATINRLGGSVSLYPRDKGGTLTEITLPLHPQQAHVDG